jgi:hypothetical protein
VRRAGGAALAALAALAVAAPAAQADHVAGTVSATLTLGETIKRCGDSGFCTRSKRATIAWNASCNGAGVESIDVSIMGVRPNGKRFAYDGETFDYDIPMTGSLDMTAGPGLRFYGEVVVTCTATVIDADGYEVEHRAKATATTEQFYLPPQVAGARTGRSSFCGVRVPSSKVDRWLQAGEYADLGWYMSFSEKAMFKPGVPFLRQFKLYARGAGIRLKRSPDRSIANQYDMIGTWVKPRRGGTLRIWATIGGHRTTTYRIKVLPKRC